MATGEQRFPLFFGRYELKIDDRHRLIVPPQVREAFKEGSEQAFFITAGPNNVPWLYAADYYAYEASRIESALSPNTEQYEYDLMQFGEAYKLTWDKQNRLLLPDSVLSETHTGDEVTLVGARTHLQLWNREAYAVERVALAKRRRELGLLSRRHATPDDQ